MKLDKVIVMFVLFLENDDLGLLVLASTRGAKAGANWNRPASWFWRSRFLRLLSWVLFVHSLCIYIVFTSPGGLYSASRL